MNMCVQIVLYFLVYVPFYRIYFDAQVGTLSYCHNKDIDDMNETIDQRRSRETIKSRFPYRDSLLRLGRQHYSHA